MRRVLLAIMIGAVLIGMLVACGPSGSSSKPSVGSPANASSGRSTGDEIDQALTQLENDLNSIDTLDDLQ